MSLVDVDLQTCTTPRKTYTLPSGAYVLSLAATNSSYAASSSSPSNSISLFDKAHFVKTHELPGHQTSITSLRSVPHFCGNSSPTLLSSGKDGYVRAWDERSGSCSIQMNGLAAGRQRSLLSCDASLDGFTVAAGTELQSDDAFILYWDPRNPAAPLRTHASTHSDDITSVQFSKSPETSHVLLSASSDGLLCTTNAREDDEDEAGLHVGNWGCSIAQSGWVRGKTNTRGIWAASDMETFSVWTGELDQVQDIDIRQPSVHRQDLTWVTDYLIGGHNRSTILPDHDNDLVVFTGSNEGDIAMLTRPTFSDANQPWHLHSLWTMNHIGVVRSCLWDEQSNVLVTGGEDAKINIWSGPSTSSTSADVGSKRENISFEMDVDEEVGSPSNKKRRF